MVRGNALHKALENLGRKIGDSERLQGMTTAETATVIAESADIAIAYLRKNNPETMTPAFSKIEQLRLCKLMTGLLELERKRSAFSIDAQREGGELATLQASLTCASIA